MEEPKNSNTKSSHKALSTLREVARNCDARDFGDLADWFRTVHQTMKRRLKPWSYVEFSELVGLGRGTWISQVVARKRSLTEASVERIASALELTATQTQMLKSLSKYSLARDPMRRQALWSRVEKSQMKRNKRLESHDLFRFLDEWQNVVVLESLSLFPQGASLENISSSIRYSISSDALQRTLSLLSSLGLATSGETGLWHKTSDDIDLGTSLPGHGVLRFHHRMIDLGKDALTHLPEQERDITALTLACPRSFLPQLKSLLENFQASILSSAREQSDPDTVYQLNMQLFPLTRPRSRS